MAKRSGIVTSTWFGLKGTARVPSVNPRRQSKGHFCAVYSNHWYSSSAKNTWLLLWTLDKWTRYLDHLFINPICLGNISEANRTLELEFLRSSGLCNSISLCIDKTWFTSPTSLKSRVAVDCQYFIQFFISFGFSWWGVCICRQERIKCNCFQVNLLNIS